MQKLGKDWLTDGLIDFEYKKYILLAYLKSVNEKFSRSRLYPALGDLVIHYNNLQRIKNNKEVLYEKFPRNISRIDFEKLKLSYKKIIEDDEIMKELDALIHYSLPRMKDLIDEGVEIYDMVEDNLSIESIGIVPLYKKEGYFFLHQELKKELMIFRYQISLIEGKNENFRGIHTRFLKRDRWSFSRTVELVKMELTRAFDDLPNPATWLITSRLQLPVQETFLPIAQRLLIQKLGR